MNLMMSLVTFLQSYIFPQLRQFATFRSKLAVRESSWCWPFLLLPAVLLPLPLPGRLAALRGFTLPPFLNIANVTSACSLDCCLLSCKPAWTQKAGAPLSCYVVPMSKCTHMHHAQGLCRQVPLSLSNDVELSFLYLCDSTCPYLGACL